MHWEWFSQQGASNPDNQDAGGIFIDSSTTFAIIADGGSKGNNGAAFAREWVRTIIDTLMNQNPIDVKIIIDGMKDAQRELRTKFLSETACYCALLILKQQNQAWGINCGDCRVGTREATHNLWLSNPHTLANAFDQNFYKRHAQLRTRNVVTRCLKSTRFIYPEVISLAYSPQQNWILATDGFWMNDLDQNPADEPYDDASYLHLSNSLSKNKTNSDCNNWYAQI